MMDIVGVMINALVNRIDGLVIAAVLLLMVIGRVGENVAHHAEEEHKRTHALIQHRHMAVRGVPALTVKNVILKDVRYLPLWVPGQDVQVAVQKIKKHPVLKEIMGAKPATSLRQSSAQH